MKFAFISIAQLVVLAATLCSAGPANGSRLGSVQVTASQQPPSVSPVFRLHFESTGSSNGSPEFVALGHQHRITLKPGGAEMLLFQNPSTATRAVRDRQWLSSVKPKSAGTIQVAFPGSNPNARMNGTEKLPGQVNYLIGSDPAQWRARLPVYGSVTVTGLYHGIDLVYYGNQQQLEYDFTVAPGASPGLIRLRFTGADHVSVNEQGELILALKGAAMRHHRPEIYQVIGGKQQRVAGGFDLIDSDTVGFWLGSYDKSLPLTIDPVLSYSSYFGGSGGDIALSVKTDAAGSIYMAGQTLSKSFTPPFDGNSFQTNFAGGSINGDGFVAKFDSTGTNLVYFTYLGGKANDGILDLAVDSEGSAYVAGFTASPNFPVSHALSPHIHGSINSTLNAYQNDAFLSKLGPDGASLVYSTYIGGSSGDVACGVAVDGSGSAFITGYTRSTNFPIVNPLPGKTKLGSAPDAFVTRLGPAGTNYIYSILLGGSGADVGEGIAVDPDGFAHVTGYTASKNFQITNAFQTKLNNSGDVADGVRDVFLAKLHPDGRLVYSTFAGSGGSESGFRVALDSSRNALVTGYTQSKNFPSTVTNIPALRAVTNKNSAVFLLKVATNPIVTSTTNQLGEISFATNDVAAIRYSAVFGGKGDDTGWDVACDANDNAFVTGITLSSDFPTLNASGMLSAKNSGKRDAFITAFNPDATALLYSVCLGGTKDDYAYGITIGPGGDAFVVGRTTSTNFPVTGALQSTRNGPNDAFLAIIQPGPLFPVSANAAQVPAPPPTE